MSTTYKPTAIVVFVDGDEYERVDMPCKWHPMATKFDWEGIAEAMHGDIVVEIEYEDGKKGWTLCEYYPDPEDNGYCAVHITGWDEPELCDRETALMKMRLYLSASVMRNKLNMVISDDWPGKIEYSPRSFTAFPARSPSRAV